MPEITCNGSSFAEIKWYCLIVCLCVPTVPSHHAAAVCWRHLQPSEFHELPALAVHRSCCPGFNLPPVYQTRPPTPF